jgi:hypothetical protein
MQYIFLTVLIFQCFVHGLISLSSGTHSSRCSEYVINSCLSNVNVGTRYHSRLQECSSLYTILCVCAVVNRVCNY